MKQPARPEPTARVAEPDMKPIETKRPAAVPAATMPAGEFWAAFVEAVRRDRKLISAWLESGALIGIEGTFVNIGFPPDEAFAKDFLEQSHREFLEVTAASILGKKVTVRLQLREGIVAAQSAQPEVKRDPMEEFKNDPLIRKALEIFRAEVQPI